MISAEQYGPWAIIAGGSEGIGACFAHRLAASGIHLILLARRVEPLQRTADALRQEHGVEVRTLALDLSSPDALSRIRAISDDVEVGALIYNAGGAGNAAALVDQSPESALGNLHLNTSTPTALVQHFAKPMRDRGRGGILLIGSLGCIAGTKELAVYSAAKSYLLTFGEAIWAELTPHGVHSLVLVIGRTLTPARHGSTGAAVSIQMHPSAGSNSLVRSEFGVAEPKEFTTIETIQYLGLIRPLADFLLA